MKALRHAQIREYFFGHGEDALAPSSMSADFGDLNIFKVVESKSSRPRFISMGANADVLGVIGGANQFAAGDADDYTSSSGSSTIYERVTPSSALINKLLAITMASPNDKHEVIRDSSVRGYIYVADVDEGKRQVRLLSPQPGHLPGSAMVLGSWPEDVAGLVS
jgi:polyribonucleotide 5'-hydroxyl-kinase